MSKKETNHHKSGDRNHQGGTEKGTRNEQNSSNERAWGGLNEGYQPIKDVASDPPTGGSGVPSKEKEA